jgi:hypothetical protein
VGEFNPTLIWFGIMPEKVKIIPLEGLEQMHTRSLLKRLKELLACEKSFELSDRFGYEPKPDPKITGFIEFKDSDEWREAYADVKEVLSQREHIPNSIERKQKRLDRAKRNKTKGKR